MVHFEIENVADREEVDRLERKAGCWLSWDVSRGAMFIGVYIALYRRSAGFVDAIRGDL
jgi:hypothetical protein